MIGLRHRLAIWAGTRLLARSVRMRGGDNSEAIIAAGDELRRVMRGR